ncbi:hypothetical protein CVT25_006669 [Psilocybe cyanescens]|uniref:Uncharacterized protein n=1 Tax=Psilocybe cyanescens TaxID=93625 RepID=A0A409W533_PSICY|nr:hypothetical protein CVT25_006669 [Psilocybe cyanescens]
MHWEPEKHGRIPALELGSRTRAQVFSQSDLSGNLGSLSYLTMPLVHNLERTLDIMIIPPPELDGMPLPIPSDAMIMQKQSEAILIWIIGALVDLEKAYEPFESVVSIFCLVVSLSTDVWTPSACKLAEVVFSGIAISHVSPPLPVPGLPGAQPPCGAVSGPFEWLVVYWATPLLYDAMAFLLTAWKAFDFWKKDMDSHLFEAIWRDGFLYFFAILAMNVANVVIFLNAPPILRAINIVPTLVFQVIISCRLVLNLKRSGSQNTSASPKSKFKSKGRDDSRQVKVDVSKWSSSDEKQAASLHLGQPPTELKILQKAQTKGSDVRNWSRPAHLWNSITSSGEMV